jgi:AraC-like DNA-binding protein
MLRLKAENILANRQAMREQLRDLDQIYQVNPHIEAESNFYKKLIEVIEENLSEENFNTSRLAECMNMSRSQLYRKILAVVNRPAGELIREIRMKHAEARLLQTDEQVSTIAYSLGFKNVSHFTKTFTAKFGVPPTRFRSQRLETE